MNDKPIVAIRGARLSLLASAVERLRDIAALKHTSKRQRVNSELAANWLLEHGYPLEEGGYLPGKGFVDQSRNGGV